MLISLTSLETPLFFLIPENEFLKFREIEHVRSHMQQRAYKVSKDHCTLNTDQRAWCTVYRHSEEWGGVDVRRKARSPAATAAWGMEPVATTEGIRSVVLWIVTLF